jgi:hypothetical protein
MHVGFTFFEKIQPGCASSSATEYVAIRKRKPISRRVSVTLFPGGKMEAILDLVQPYVREILAALTAALVTLIRAWVQQRVAMKAAEKQERANHGLPGVEKKVRAMEQVTSELPLGVRPFTQAGLGRLIEAAHKRISDKPPEK